MPLPHIGVRRKTLGIVDILDQDEALPPRIRLNRGKKEGGLDNWFID